ncbi:MAG: tRNA dimethylallyltransferase [Flavobacteriaceae bacterium]|jgi:tRNA dimethylallyltransferase
MQGIQHYFIDSHSLNDEVSAADYEKQALEILDREFLTKDVVILTGGSGMFVDALCKGLDKIPMDKTIRQQLNDEFKKNGLAPLLDELEDNDPVYYEQVDRQNPVRIMRALEVIRITDRPYSDLRKAKPIERPFQVHRYAIDHERQALYDRINLRVDLMIKNGLIEEVESVKKFRQLTSMNTVGYKELFSFLDGESTKEEAISMIKQNSRRYAKRQLTWIRRHSETQWVKWITLEQIKKEISTHFSNLINLE